MPLRAVVRTLVFSTPITVTPSVSSLYGKQFVPVLRRTCSTGGTGSAHSNVAVGVVIASATPTPTSRPAQLGSPPILSSSHHRFYDTSHHHQQHHHQLHQQRRNFCSGKSDHDKKASMHAHKMTSKHSTPPLSNSSIAGHIQDEMTMDADIAILMKQNKEWAFAQYEKDPKFFAKMASSQAPDFLYIGCSDSRVPSSTILGLGPGELFVHRNVGNVFCSTDFNALTTLEFAVKHLKVKHILVVGHYGCGAINAAMSKQDHGTIENWLRNIRDVYRLHCQELDSIPEKDARLRRLVELNVVESCLNVYKTGIVQQTRLGSVGNTCDKKKPFALPRVHGLVYDPADGILQPLPINFKVLIERYQHIYDLYEPPEKGTPKSTPKHKKH